MMKQYGPKEVFFTSVRLRLLENSKNKKVVAEVPLVEKGLE